MTSPGRSALAWKAGIALSCLLGGVPCPALDIQYSVQPPVIAKAYIGAVPKGVTILRALACNTGATEERFFPAVIGFEASKVVPQLDPAAALYAARHYREGSKVSIALGIASTLIPYAGIAVPLLGALKVGIPDLAVGVTSGLAAGKVALDSATKAARTLDVPANWLSDEMSERILQAGRCEAFLLAVGGKPPLQFGRSTYAINVSALEREQAEPLITGAAIQKTGVSFNSGWEVTADELEETHQYAEMVARMIRERSAAIGAQH